MMKKLKKQHKGSLLPLVLIASFLFIAFAYSLVAIAMSNLNMAKYNEKQISALEVAEGGANYYMWHLSHNNTDYCDGHTPCTGTAAHGPYVHDFTNNNGDIIGQYTLTITPPAPGDSIVNVKSVGKINGSSANRTIVTEIGMPSFARYAFLTGTEAWFGSTETTNGPVHSNIGIHFDGIANGTVSSSSGKVEAGSGGYVPSYAFGGDDTTHHDGVWGSGGPTGYWVFPVPTVDFAHVSADLNTLKTAANSGILLDKTTGSKKGYYLKLKPNNTIEVYYVTAENNTTGITISALVHTYSAPINGIIYVSDNVWVDGTYGAPITIASVADSGQDTKIKIKDNLLYTTKDGSAKIGLIAKGDIQVPWYAPTNIEIDAALLSQNGHVWYPTINNQYGPLKNNGTITVYGSISSFNSWTWSYMDSSDQIFSGYPNTVQTYDPNLTLGPPPQFPTTGSYTILTWKEE